MLMGPRGSRWKGIKENERWKGIKENERCKEIKGNEGWKGIRDGRGSGYVLQNDYLLSKQALW